MKKCFFFLCCLGYAWSLNAQAVWNNNSFVHRSGRTIQDGDNNTIRLEGVNLGSWLMWEGWIWGGGFTQEKTIYTKIKNKLGQAQADDFRAAVYRNYITRNDIQAIASQCFNVVRIPFNHSLLEDDDAPFVYKPEGWAVLDSVLGWCELYNVYAVLDLHAAPGGQSSYFIADPDTPNLWSDTAAQTRTARLWQAIADRYQDRGIIAGYDLLNEPAAPSDSALLSLYKRIIDSIRTVDTDHLLFLEGKNSSTDFSLFTDLPDDNVAFGFHFYSWFVFNIPNALAKYVTLSESLDVPVWCGEWGENNYDQLSTTLQSLRLPSSQISGGAFWTWKKHRDGSNYPAYISIDTSYYWDKTIKWIGNVFAPQPTNAEMQQGLADFIQNMQLQNCTFDATMNDVLRPCASSALALLNSEVQPLRVYPVPASQSIQVVIPNDISIGTGKISVWNAADQFVGEWTVPTLTQTYLLDLSNYANGVYFIRLDLGDAHYFTRIVVNQ